MSSRLIRIGSFIAWLSVFFMPGKSVKRYMPVTIFSALILVTVTFIGQPYGFWEVKGGPKKRMWNLLTLVLGYFSIACLWTFHFTFGKLWLYLVTNVLNNFIFAAGIIPFLQKVNFVKYAKFTQVHHFVVTLVYCIILYGYQLIYDRPSSKRAFRSA